MNFLKRHSKVQNIGNNDRLPINPKKKKVEASMLRKEEKKGFKKNVVSPNRRGALMTTNNKYTPSDFFTRENCIVNQTIRIPQSSDKVLIVPTTFDGWGFIVDFYNPEFCGPISEPLFKQAIRRVNDIIEGVRCLRSSIERKNYTGLHNILLLSGLILIILGFIVAQYAVLRQKLDIIYYYIAGACFTLVGLLSFGLFIFVFIFKQEEMPSEQEIFKRVANVLEELNATQFKPLGYEWRTTSRFFWLELAKVNSVVTATTTPVIASANQLPQGTPSYPQPNTFLQKPVTPVQNN